MAKPRFVMHVLWTLGYGGTERLVLDLVKHPPAGSRVCVLALGGSGALEAAFRDGGVEYEIAPIGGRLKMLRWLFARVRALRPDIIHTHLGADIWAGFIARWFKIPWVSTQHSLGEGESVKVYVGRAWLLKKADRVIALTPTMKVHIIARYHLDPARVRVIPNGVDFDAFPYHPHLTHADIPRLVCVGRLVTEKNQETLVRALAYRREPCRLLLVGDGEDRAYLTDMAISLGVFPRVQFLPATPRVADVLAHQDVMCVPSLREGQGRVVAEALASGIPLIVSDLPVLRAWLPKDVCLFADPCDPVAWAQAIEIVFRDPQAAHARAERGRVFIEQKLSLDKTLREHISLYRSLL